MFNNPHDALPFVKFNPPYNWVKHNLTVLYDRHLPDGTRQHIVSEDISVGTILDNAEVHSVNDPEIIKYLKDN